MESHLILRLRLLPAAVLGEEAARRLVRLERKARTDGSGVLGLSWRGSAADAASGAAAAQALPGVRLEGWEVER